MEHSTGKLKQKKTSAPNTIDTGKLYGLYSFGSFREWMFTEEGIRHIKKVVSDDLDSINIGTKDLTDMTVLDIGTGRQALAFHLLGAKWVEHFDISQEHVSFFQKYIADNGLKNVTSTWADITQYPLEENKYDFVYLNGVVQHFDNTEKGLINLAKATSIGGLIWLYFYRSGSFKRFVVEMLRDLIDASYLEEVRTAAAALYSCSVEEKIISQIMDDSFVPFAQLFSPEQITQTMKMFGFSVFSSQKVEPLEVYDHIHTHHSSIIIFKKEEHIDYSQVKETPVRNPISQLKDIHYKEPIIRENIRLYREIKGLVEAGKVNRKDLIDLCLTLHRISSPMYYPDNKPVLGDPTYYIEDYKTGDHQELNKTLFDFFKK